MAEQAGAEIAKEAANSWKKVEELQTKLAEALLKNEELEMIETEHYILMKLILLFSHTQKWNM